MSDNTPLLGSLSASGGRDDEEEQQRSTLGDKFASCYRACRAATQRFFSSHARHWVILTLIILDVAGILTDIFIALITCELGRDDEPWVRPTRNGLTTFSLVMSCIFVVELILSVFADGWGYFTSWFHCFDAFVIVVSFAIDLLEHGNVAEEIASLVVILRLWRFVKIVNEFSVETSEQTEGLRERIKELETHNAALEAQLMHR
ncbi:hypothetical protein F4778DRAFT_167101 [Xylariomycetidae sp. FL2044]|nr:hypothetical protein F4778DRAFT_167101 [Xylariomycetidae sp. FL2044]